jgi:hypothetical protein
MVRRAAGGLDDRQRLAADRHFRRDRGRDRKERRAGPKGQVRRRLPAGGANSSLKMPNSLLAGKIQGISGIRAQMGPTLFSPAEFIAN